MKITVEQVGKVFFLYLINQVRYGTRGESGGGGAPLPLLKIENSAMILENCGPDSVHIWIKFSIQSLVLYRIYWRKDSKIFPAGPFFLVFLTKYLSKSPNSREPPPTLKRVWLRASKYRLYRLKCQN